MTIAKNDQNKQNYQKLELNWTKKKY